MRRRYGASPWHLLGRWLDDPAGGPALAYRQLLRHGLRDAGVLARLKADADRRRGRLCPHCYAAVPLDLEAFPAADAPAPLSLARGRLSGHGFVVDVAEGVMLQIR